MNYIAPKYPPHARFHYSNASRPQYMCFAVYFNYEEDAVMGKRREQFLSLTNREGLLFMRQRGYEHVQDMVADGKLDCIKEAALPSPRRKNVGEPACG